MHELWSIGLDQHGYVTSSKAIQVGVNKTLLPQLSRSGAHPPLRRVAHGIYRFREDRIPVDEWDAYQMAALWPAGRGVLSHETALQLHELCDVNPAEIHLTAPS